MKQTVDTLTSTHWIQSYESVLSAAASAMDSRAWATLYFFLPSFWNSYLPCCGSDLEWVQTTRIPFAVTHCRCRLVGRTSPASLA